MSFENFLKIVPLKYILIYFATINIVRIFSNAY